MYEFCQRKYIFKLACLWRKLEFYTRVHTKIYLLLLFKSFKWWLVFMITSWLYSCFTHDIGHYYLISFTKQYFFLNSNPDSLLLKKTQGWSHFKLNMIDEIFHFYKISRIYQWIGKNVFNYEKMEFWTH